MKITHGACKLQTTSRPVPNLFCEIIAVVDAVTSALLECRWKLKIMNKNSVAFHRVLMRSRGETDFHLAYMRIGASTFDSYENPRSE